MAKANNVRQAFLGLSEKMSKRGGYSKLNKREKTNYNRWANDSNVVGASSSLTGRRNIQGNYKGPEYGPALSNTKRPGESLSTDPVDMGPRAVSTSGGWAQSGMSSKAGGLGSWAGNNIRGSLQKDQTVLGVAAGHAMRGAVGGGAIGGATEAAQGGDFWAGAKAGAFNGAVGWGGYRMGMRATGATSYNPLAGLNSKNPNKQGIAAAAGRMVNTTSTKSNVSKQASTLLNHQQQLGLQQSIYNAGKKV